MNKTVQADIRGVLIQVAGARLLLPNATIAEVLSFADPEPVADAPDWLLGKIRWRGWQLPLIAFSRLAGIADEKGGLGSKVIVLKALGGDPKAPFFAVLTQGFPRLVTVSEAALVTEETERSLLPNGVQARVTLNQDDALVPDLAAGPLVRRRLDLRRPALHVCPSCLRVLPHLRADLLRDDELLPRRRGSAVATTAGVRRACARAAPEARHWPLRRWLGSRVARRRRARVG